MLLPWEAVEPTGAINAVLHINAEPTGLTTKKLTGAPRMSRFNKHSLFASGVAAGYNSLREVLRMKLTEKEIETISNSIDGLRLVADYHDTQIVMSESMGMSAASHEERREELLTEVAKLEDEL
jgi:hypothetical protein